VARWGLEVVRTQVGDRYVVEEMRRGGHTFGGEQSGHLVFLDHATTGDGTLAALQVLAMLCRKKKSLSELTSIFEPVPQTLLSFGVRERRPLEQFPDVQRAIRGAEASLGSEGRVLVRFSGTESKVRILVEGPDRERNDAHAQQIADALSTVLG
jgi:phosphoglucosamine mutase